MIRNVSQMQEFLARVDTAEVSIAVITLGLHGALTGLAAAAVSKEDPTDIHSVKIDVNSPELQSIVSQLSSVGCLVAFNALYVSRTLLRECGISLLCNHDPMLYGLYLGDMRYSYASLVDKYLGITVDDDVILDPVRAQETASHILMLDKCFTNEFAEIPIEFYALESETASIMGLETEMGLLVDTQKLTEAARGLQEVVDEGKEELSDLASSYGIKGFSPNSTKKVATLLYDKLGLEILRKTPKGAPSTSAEALKPHAKNETVAKLQHVRSTKKTLDGLNSVLKEAGVATSASGTSVVRPDWRTAQPGGIVRIYAQKPSMTNLPLQAMDAFIPFKNMQWVAFDYKAAELAYLASLTDDAEFRSMFEPGNDVHAKTAEFLFGPPGDEDEAKTNRKKAKTLNFATVYSGGNPIFISDELEISVSEAEGMVKDYFLQFPGLKSLMDELAERAVTEKVAESYLGYLRPLLGERDDNALRNRGVNTTGQNSVATILKQAIFNIFAKAVGQNIPVRGFIPMFDCLFFQVPETLALDDVKDLFNEAVELEVNGLKMTVSWQEGGSLGAVKSKL